jgi:hypothetical protein
MKTGQPIKVAGGVTGLLLHNLRSGIIPILKEQVSYLHPIQIEAASLEAPSKTRSAVMTGLSCGIDSLSTVCTYLDHPVADLRITHLSFHDVGSHGRMNTESVFSARLASIRAAAAELGLPLIVARSNLASCLVSTFKQHHTLWNSSVAIALRKGVGTYLFSSSVPYTAVKVGPSQAISWADPIVLPLLSGSGVYCVSSNAQMTRVEKTALIADWPFAQRWLDVCVRPAKDGSNCSECWKCCRTILTLELLGSLEGFRGKFDLKKYGKVKNSYVSHLLNKHADPIEAEVIKLAQQRKVTLDSLPRRLGALSQRWIARASPFLPPAIRWRLQRLCHGF